MTIGTHGPGDVSLGTGDRVAAVGEVKAVLRIALADEDMLIAAFVEAALGLAERFTGRVLIARVMTDTMAASAAWQRIAAEPVRAITGVGVLDAGGVATALAVGGYAVDLDAQGGGWVRVPSLAGRIAVSFSAGLATDWAGLPGPLRQGVVLLAAHLFTTRDAAAAPPAAISALWRPFRTMALLPARHAC